jgi:hypothetical protein
MHSIETAPRRRRLLSVLGFQGSVPSQVSAVASLPLAKCADEAMDHMILGYEIMKNDGELLQFEPTPLLALLRSPWP